MKDSNHSGKETFNDVTIDDFGLLEMDECIPDKPSPLLHQLMILKKNKQATVLRLRDEEEEKRIYLNNAASDYLNLQQVYHQMELQIQTLSSTERTQESNTELLYNK